MPTLQTYEVPIGWAPPSIVNVPPTYEYLAWRLSVDPLRGTELWTIQQVAATPSMTIEQILPEGALELSVGDGNTIQQYGYTPAVYPGQPLDGEGGIVSTIIAHKDYVEGELVV